MTYEIFDTESGDVLGSFAAAKDAARAATELLMEHPELRDDIAIFVIDARGVRVGEPTWVADLVAPPLPGVVLK
jgi:hypothetical protein